MRVVERKMNAAVTGKRNFSDGANTRVMFHVARADEPEHDVTEVRLHNNQILTAHHLQPNVFKVELGLCGWDTRTTRSRLNALGKLFDFSIYKEKGQTFMVLPNGLHFYIEDTERYTFVVATDWETQA